MTVAHMQAPSREMKDEYCYDFSLNNEMIAVLIRGIKWQQPKPGKRGPYKKKEEESRSPA
jgi:hypothetical protein